MSQVKEQMICASNAYWTSNAGDIEAKKADAEQAAVDAMMKFINLKRAGNQAAADQHNRVSRLERNRDTNMKLTASFLSQTRELFDTRHDRVKLRAQLEQARGVMQIVNPEILPITSEQISAAVRDPDALGAVPALISTLLRVFNPECQEKYNAAAEEAAQEAVTMFQLKAMTHMQTPNATIEDAYQAAFNYLCTQLPSAFVSHQVAHELNPHATSQENRQDGGRWASLVNDSDILGGSSRYH